MVTAAEVQVVQRVPFFNPLNEWIKQSQPSQIAGKGHNETLEIVIPMGHTTTAKSVTGIHVPENGGTCGSHFCNVFRRSHSNRLETIFYCKWSSHRRCIECQKSVQSLK
jgi:hypothetical protein